jgi:hypothetical protein
MNIKILFNIFYLIFAVNTIFKKVISKFCLFKNVINWKCNILTYLLTCKLLFNKLSEFYSAYTSLNFVKNFCSNLKFNFKEV